MTSIPPDDVLAQAAANMIVRWECSEKNPVFYSPGVIYDKISCQSTRSSSELYLDKNDLKWALGTLWVRRAMKITFLPDAEYNKSWRVEDSIKNVSKSSYQIRFSSSNGTYKYQMRGRIGDVVQEVLYVKTKLMEYAPEATLENKSFDDEIEIHHHEEEEEEQEEEQEEESDSDLAAKGSDQIEYLKRYYRLYFRMKAKEQQLQERLTALEKEVAEQADVINRMETLQCSELSSEERSQYIGQTLVKLSTAAGVYKKAYEGSNNQETLSLETGIMKHDLTSTCLVSMEKLPLVIADVLQMLFGYIPEDNRNDLIFCSKTYTKVKERNSMFIGATSKAVFTEPGETSVVHACITQDESHKRDNVSLKMVSHSCEDGKTRLRACNTDLTLSKKTENIANNTLDSLKREITERGMIKIFAATSDNAAIPTMGLILQHADGMRARPEDHQLTEA